MSKKKVLVLGNGPQISNIKFDKLDPNIITLGINRIWLKHYPNYFFFHDYEILKELNNEPIHKVKLRSISKSFSSDWIDRSGKDSPSWVTKYSRLNRRNFPDSITTSIPILIHRILSESPSNVQLYLAGVNLKWTNPSHFWKSSDFDSLNKHNKEWYSIRFQKMLHNFKQLRTLGYNMVSVTPDSNLNKIMRYINISNLYKKD